MSEGFSAKQLAFIDARVKGLNRLESCRVAGYSESSHTVVESNRVKQEIERLKKISDRNAVGLLERTEKRRILAGIARNKTNSARDRMQAIAHDNLMDGSNAPQKVEMSGLADLLAIVRGHSQSEKVVTPVVDQIREAPDRLAVQIESG
ncbi:MAG: hypothetical protein Unbinned1322contig1001_13 [Prokaryotic dsDNA virus sp.]|nr:MAG: hypothetical protein Unbinned1322contig1001_13 [Prokaryotic dsDNA virus sp.]|tara:strand:- start:280 stop:726 length:447 start_codon:yes stop_codon:yes gene_type:complete